MKTVPLYLLGIIAAAALIYKAYTREQERTQERERRLAAEKQREAERRDFETNMSFVLAMVDARDIEIYNLAIARDKAIMAAISNELRQCSWKYASQAKRVDDLIWSLNHHIEDCKRIVSRIGEGRAHNWDIIGIYWSTFDIYQTKCDCDCCAKQ